MDTPHSLFLLTEVKRGGKTSNEGDANRDKFIRWLIEYRHDDEDVEDDCNGLQWVEVQYGDDNGDSVVTRASDDEPERTE